MEKTSHIISAVAYDERGLAAECRVNIIVIGDTFNKVLWELKGRSWSEKEIIDAFEYTGKSLDIMEQLYDVKDTLLTHFMELSTKEEYKDRIVVRKKKDERAETSYDDVLYVFAKGIARPLTFHCKLDGKEVAGKVELIFDRPFYAKRIEEITGRSLEDLRQEIPKLAECGYREIVLTGIHLSSYGKDLSKTESDGILNFNISILPFAKVST